MTRKRRKRAQKPAAAVGAPGDMSREVMLAARSALVCRFLQFAVLLSSVLLFGVFVAVLCILRWRSAPGTWPARDDLGLSVKLAAGGALALVVSSLAVYFARRSLNGGRPLTGRLCLAAALLLVVLALALRMREYRALYLDGIALTSPRTFIFDEADLYYLHAVKERLKQLSRELEDRRANRPHVFSDEEQRRLSLVTTLQNRMVGWTEQEVGHWLDDTQLRRDLIELMAFQIHPTAGRRAAARERVEVEKGDLNRRRQWFAVLRDYCRQQSPTDERQQAAKLSETLQRLGASQWAYAEAVRHDARDTTMIGERLNQINLSLSSMDAREAFVREYLDPLGDTPAAPGLNRALPGLRLPVSFPHARAWTASYALITLWHTAMLTLSALALVWVLSRRSWPARSASLVAIAPFWHSTAALGVVVLGILYCW